MHIPEGRAYLSFFADTAENGRESRGKNVYGEKGKTMEKLAMKRGLRQ